MNSSTKLLILIRGLPGSGKSTLAELLKNLYLEAGVNVVHAEADQYFTDVVTGQYTWDADYLSQAHFTCQVKVAKAMQQCVPVILVSNVFYKLWQAKPYFNLASIYGYQKQILLCQGNFGSIHGAPPEKIERMKRDFELWLQ